MLNLKPTHQSKTKSQTDVTAWQFHPDKPIPVWVARKFHMLGDRNVREAIGSDGKIVKLRPGDWAVSICTEGVMVALTDEEFKMNFRSL